MIVDRKFLERAIHYIPHSRLVYLQNAKAACSSTKKSLWLSLSKFPYDEAKGPHERRRSPFCRTLEDIAAEMDGFSSSTFFTIVRNPYSRVLSAYLDKISHSRKDARIWGAFADRYGLSSDTVPPFGQFLEIVTSEDPCLLDQHFAPQYVNVLYSFVSFDFIGRLEAPEEAANFLERHGVAAQRHQRHATGADSLISQFYGPNEIRTVQDYYHRDFESFGYSENPESIAPQREVVPQRVDKKVLQALVWMYAARHPDARRRAVESVSNHVGGFLKEYGLLDTATATGRELDEMARSTVVGSENWKLRAKVAQELLRHDRIQEGAVVAQQAKELFEETQRHSRAIVARRSAPASRASRW